MYAMKYIVILLLSSLASPAQAQNIYKSIDEQGNVSYSSIKPAENVNAEMLPPTPEPSAADIEASRQQQEALQKSLAESREKREEKEESKQRQQAEAENRVSTVTQQHYVPIPVYPARRHTRPVTLPAIRPINRPR